MGSVLTWGSIRGGASVALAMSLNNYEGRETVFSMTYAVVLFSLIGQGLTIPKVFKWLYLPEHVKEKGSNRIMGEKDEILNKLLDAVSTSPELKEHLDKQGIDTDRLSQISGHTGSDSDTHSRDGMGGSPRLGTSPEDMRDLLENAKKASNGLHMYSRGNDNRNRGSIFNSRMNNKQKQSNGAEDYVPGVGRVTRRYSKSGKLSSSTPQQQQYRQANEYSKVRSDYNRTNYGSTTSSSMNVPMKSPQSVPMESPQKSQRQRKKQTPEDMLNVSVENKPRSNQDDSPLTFVHKS